MNENLKPASSAEIPDVSIVIPVYNEGPVIESVLHIILRMDFGAYVKEVVVVDDGSNDNTRTVLEKFQKTKGVKMIFRPANGGKGAAVRDGIKEATGRVIVIQDADLEYDPTQILMLAIPILEGQAKVVYGSRFKGQIRRMTPTRRLANRVLTSYINLVFRANISDACTCYKIFAGEVIKGFGLKSDGFEICHEMTAQTLRRSYDILELPVSYCARGAKEGVKSSWKDFVKQLFFILHFRYCRLTDDKIELPEDVVHER